jgi:hypothetical protein
MHRVPAIQRANLNLEASMATRAYQLEDAQGDDAERVLSLASETTKRPSDARNGRKANLKYSDKGIELVPQPSDDPRDPLVCNQVSCYSSLWG